MAFRFRLERVLSVRRSEEEEAERRHAEARQARARAVAVLERARAALVRAHERLDDLKRSGELTSEDLYLHASHVAGLRRRVEEAGQEVRTADARVQETHQALLEAHQAREALEKLREREETRWREAERRRETRVLDEIALSRRSAGEEERHGQ